MTVNRRRWSGIIMVLVGVASLLLVVSACTSQDNEATALLQDPQFGLAHLNDEFHTIKGEDLLANPKFGLAHLNDEFHTIKKTLDSLSAQIAGTEIKGVAFQPGRLGGGSKTVSASGNGVLWVLPGLRRLDPNVFGTPQQPLGLEPGVGVSLENRLTNEDGTAYTTTKNPTPFGDKAIGTAGDFSLKAIDATSNDGPATEDQVTFISTFTGPNDKEYTIKVDRVLSRGPNHTFLGGVGTNFVHHGRTGIGFKMMPQLFAYVAFWGVAELSIDGEIVASNRFIHAMLTDNVREAGYQLAFDEGVDPSRLQFHIFLPPLEVTPEGPKPSPVPTGFILPNGNEQPFLHINFESVTLDFVGTQR